jgi:hypothetical protein
MAEFGIVEKLGAAGLEALVARIVANEAEDLPSLAREALLDCCRSNL